jgi:hypothetical protein
MKAKLIAIVTSSIIMVVLFLTIGSDCDGKECLHDDASIRIEALIVPLILIYSLVSWLSVFPVTLYLHKWMPVPVAALVASSIFSVAELFLLHSPEVDGTFKHTVTFMLPLVFVPWFVSSWVAAIMWTKKDNASLHRSHEERGNDK